MKMPTASAAGPVRLSLGENLAQLSLLVLVNAFVGAMVGLERSILPAMAEQEFQLVARTALPCRGLYRESDHGSSETRPNASYPPDRGVTEADGFRHPARTPVRRATRRRFQRANDHAFHLRIRDAALGPWPRLIVEPVQSIHDEPPAPFADRARVTCSRRATTCCPCPRRTPR
jgi:hypothetical protein